MVAIGYKQWEQKSFQSRFANTNDPKYNPRSVTETHYFPMGSAQYDPVFSGVKIVGVNRVITSVLSLGKLPKQKLCWACRAILHSHIQGKEL